jgi:hypothetical protein
MPAGAIYPCRMTESLAVVLTCGRNDNGGDDDADTPTRAAGAKRTRREGLLLANAPARFSG